MSITSPSVLAGEIPSPRFRLRSYMIPSKVSKLTSMGPNGDRIGARFIDLILILSSR